MGRRGVTPFATNLPTAAQAGQAHRAGMLHEDKAVELELRSVRARTESRQLTHTHRHKLAGLTEAASLRQAVWGCAGGGNFRSLKVSM